MLHNLNEPFPEQHILTFHKQFEIKFLHMFYERSDCITQTVKCELKNLNKNYFNWALIKCYNIFNTLLQNKSWQYLLGHNLSFYLMSSVSHHLGK